MDTWRFETRVPCETLELWEVLCYSRNEPAVPNGVPPNRHGRQGGSDYFFLRRRFHFRCSARMSRQVSPVTSSVTGT